MHETAFGLFNGGRVTLLGGAVPWAMLSHFLYSFMYFSSSSTASADHDLYFGLLISDSGGTGAFLLPFY